jgi:hypothetical protein
VPVLDPNQGDDVGPPRRLDLDQHTAIAGQDLPEPAQETGNIAPDPDVPVDQER